MCTQLPAPVSAFRIKNVVTFTCGLGLCQIGAMYSYLDQAYSTPVRANAVTRDLRAHFEFRISPSSKT